VKLLARHLLIEISMTNTEFMIRQKSGAHHPLFRVTEIQFRPVDAALIVAFLSAFVGLVLLLSK
jgi:hypothetical protein